MTRTNLIILLMGGLLAATPMAYGGESASMSDSQHRKTMGGMHHPDKQMEGMKGEQPMMSDAQHKKHMGGGHHPAAEEHGHKGEDGNHPAMSDSQHRKHMGAGKHEYHERTDNPED